MQTIEHRGERIRTGPLKIGDDWTGIFIRGDEALSLAGELNASLGNQEFCQKHIKKLIELLESSYEQK